ncbi:hypothetical protein Taro_000031, partial [Colocasia esculenta]|nr:hypothetical protein [Colocasia esculenta]
MRRKSPPMMRTNSKRMMKMMLNYTYLQHLMMNID